MKQVSVFVENQQGKLLEIISMLGEAGIDLCAMSIADTADFGILRLICDNPSLAQALLSNEGCIVTVNEVVGICVPDSPGGLASVLSIIDDNNLSIEYIYAFITHRAGTANIIIRFDDNDIAVSVLTAKGIKLLDDEDMTK